MTEIDQIEEHLATALEMLRRILPSNTARSAPGAGSRIEQVFFRLDEACHHWKEWRQESGHRR
jgi:hypothetical protein